MPAGLEEEKKKRTTAAAAAAAVAVGPRTHNKTHKLHFPPLLDALNSREGAQRCVSTQSQSRAIPNDDGQLGGPIRGRVGGTFGSWEPIRERGREEE
ncbi:hypothetical protein NQZ68_017300 [Scomber scombrus]|uniref:Uncharacterized protein n=1 Tax=Scomber scombrus TaxID=13677 RepID=A0AAV1PK40_SCOSC